MKLFKIIKAMFLKEREIFKSRQRLNFLRNEINNINIILENTDANTHKYRAFNSIKKEKISECEIVYDYIQTLKKHKGDF
jgi:hypothetical protein